MSSFKLKADNRGNNASKRSGLFLDRGSSGGQSMDFLAKHNHEVGIIVRLLQKIRLELNTTLVFLIIFACRVNGHRNRKFLLVADSFQAFQAVHSRHVDVKKNVIRLFQDVGREDVKGILTIVRSNEYNSVVDLFQCIIEDLDIVGVIIDEQDSQVRFRHGDQLIIRHISEVEIAEKIGNYLR